MPEYICKRNEEVKKAQEEYDNYIQEQLRKAAMKRLSDEEREGVLQVSVLSFLLLCNWNIPERMACHHRVLRLAL